MIQTRIRLIRDICSWERTCNAVADILAVSRQSVSKWVAMYRIEWEAWLIPKKSGPRSGSPVNRTPRSIEERVIALALIYPTDWPRALALKYSHESGYSLNQSTIYRILRRNHTRYTKRGEWQRKRKKLYSLDTPGREIQLDACFPFGRVRSETQYDAIDDCSRFVYSRLHVEYCVSESCAFVASLVKSSPFKISRIRTDCGGEFWPGFTRYLTTIGIEHVRNAPYSPQHNGKVERYHRTLWQNLWEYSTRIPAEEYQLRLALFVDWYNYQKPHSWLAMNGLTPIQKIAICFIYKSFRYC